MPKWSTSCPDWAERLRAGKSIIPPPIFPDEADAGLAVMRDLHIVDAPGSPRMEDACGQWVFDLAATIFGAYDAQTGRRLIKEWFVMLPKKNFKSGLAASIMLTCLIRNWRRSAEFTILAPTKEVAENSFGPAKDMVLFQEDDEDEEECSELSDLIHVQEHIKTLTHREMNAKLKVIAADPSTTAGKKSVGILVEELWLFGKDSNAKDMLREASGGLASRPEGFIIYITTQSDDPPAGVFKEKLEYARKVRDGDIEDPQFMPILFEHPPEMVKSEECMLLENLPMVNPNMGYSVDADFLSREYRKAADEGKDSLKGFLAKYGNVEVGMNLRSDRWAGAEFWLPNALPKRPSLTEFLDRCEVVVSGTDGGGLDDLLGLVLAGREKGTRRWLAWARAWAHKIALERRKEIAPRLRDFVRDGDLVIVETPGQDVSDVADILCQARASGLMPTKMAVGVDAAGIGDIVTELTTPERGFQPDEIIAISQGWRLNGAIKTTERRLAGGELVHCGQPLMAWCVSNAKTEKAGNAVYVSKAVSGSGKIDPLMALFNAVSLLNQNPEAAVRTSIYEQGIGI